MKIYDAILVGSGASGSWVAKELTEQGMETLMLEAGPPRIPSRDFTEHVWPYQLKFRGFGDQTALPKNHVGERFFRWMKAKVVQGFLTCKAGLKELDYKGNSFYVECPGCTDEDHSS